MLYKVLIEIEKFRYKFGEVLASKPVPEVIIDNDSSIKFNILKSIPLKDEELQRAENIRNVIGLKKDTLIFYWG